MKLRSVLSASALALLVWPASAILPSAEWNVHVWNRLRLAHRRAPDTDTDDFYRQLAAYTPPDASIGLLLAPSMKATDASRATFMLEYALAPRQLVPGSDAALVVTLGLPAPGEPVSDPARFVLVHDFGEGLRLYRRAGS